MNEHKGDGPMSRGWVIPRDRDMGDIRKCIAGHPFTFKLLSHWNYILLHACKLYRINWWCPVLGFRLAGASSTCKAACI